VVIVLVVLWHRSMNCSRCTPPVLTPCSPRAHPVLTPCSPRAHPVLTSPHAHPVLTPLLTPLDGLFTLYEASVPWESEAISLDQPAPQVITVTL
jgi:hypothetical protein